MNQISLATTGFELVTKRTRKRVFLDEMNLVVPWTELVDLIRPFAASGTGVKGGRPPFAVETMLRIHFLQQWFGLSDPAMQEALHDVSLYCEFARLDSGSMHLPDETTILRFRHLLEENNLSIQLLAAINATLATKGLVLNMIVLWNTLYMQAALNQLRANGEPVNDADVARLSPLLHEHINMLGRYSFSMPEAVAKGELRPLRDSTDPSQA